MNFSRFKAATRNTRECVEYGCSEIRCGIHREIKIFRAFLFRFQFALNKYCDIIDALGGDLDN